MAAVFECRTSLGLNKHRWISKEDSLLTLYYGWHVKDKPCIYSSLSNMKFKTRLTGIGVAVVKLLVIQRSYGCH